MFVRKIWFRGIIYVDPLIANAIVPNIWVRFIAIKPNNPALLLNASGNMSVLLGTNA